MNPAWRKPLAAGAAVLVVALFFSCHGARKPPAVLPEDVAFERARAALEGIRARKPGDRRPVGFDDLMGPLGDLNTRVRDRLADAALRPDGPVKDDALVEVAALARDTADLARAGRGLAREIARPGQEPMYFRLPELEADACQYWAEAAFMRHYIARAAKPAVGDAPAIDDDTARALREIIDRGLALQPDHRQLLRLSGQLDNLRGFYAAAESALERAVAAHPEFAEAWGALGISRFQMHEYAEAEEAFVRARDLAAAQAEGTEGETYRTAVYNLARLHEGLFDAARNRYRAGATDERAAALRHREEALKAMDEYLAAAPPGDPAARELKDRAALLREITL